MMRRNAAVDKLSGEGIGRKAHVHTVLRIVLMMDKLRRKLAEKKQRDYYVLVMIH